MADGGSFLSAGVGEPSRRAFLELDRRLSGVQATIDALSPAHGDLTGLGDDDHPQYAFRNSSPTITLSGDASGSVTLTNLGNGTLSVTVADDSHNHIISNVDGLQTALDGKAASGHTHSYLPLSGGTLTGTLKYTLLNGPSGQTRDKIRVWDSSYYTIGMQSGYTYGHLNDYAMTFQMNNDSDRGFWWGDDNHSNAQGAMSLTTNGKLTVATSLSVGQGESITGPSISTLYVGGNAFVSGPMYIGSSGDSYLYFRDSNSGAWREIYWDDSENRFRSGHNIKFDGYVHSKNNFYVGDNGMGDSDIYFYDDNTNTWRTMRWDDSANDWAVEDNGGTMRTLYHSGNIPSYASSSHTHSYAPSSHTHYIDAWNAGRGLAYVGATVGGGSANLIGFRWASPFVNCTVDNVIAAGCANFSDRRIKTDIIDSDVGISAVNMLRPVTYRPLDIVGFDQETGEPEIGEGDAGSPLYGFIADEVQDIIPSAVRGEGIELKSIDSVQLLAVVVKALQEIDRRLTALEAV